MLLVLIGDASHLGKLYVWNVGSNSDSDHFVWNIQYICHSKDLTGLYLSDSTESGHGMSEKCALNIVCNAIDDAFHWVLGHGEQINVQYNFDPYQSLWRCVESW